MYEILKNLDRRWIFLLLLISVAVPILLELQFPETATPFSQAVFDEIEKLPEGAPVLISYDFDPASEGELKPMATTLVRHCCEKKLKIYFMALWPLGSSLVDETIRDVIRIDFPNLAYGTDYVNLGFKSGYEGVIKVIVTDLRGLYTTDARGTALDQIPMCRGIPNIQSMKLLVSISAGYPGAKEWVQYAATPYRDKLRIVAGSTGVQSPQLFPYIPNQLPGLLAAIKGAAEYEKLVNDKYSHGKSDPKYLEAIRRMGPQLIAHLVVIGLIVAGNWVYFMQRWRRE